MRTRVKRKMDSRPSEQMSTAHRYTSAKTNRHQISDIIKVRLVCGKVKLKKDQRRKNGTCK